MAAKETDTQRPNVPLVRIFLSSPGDVAEEREVAREFIKNELAYRSGLRDELALQVIAWDDPAARIPMLATETPQDSVNAARPRPADCDIVIVILWSRMGTPLPDTTLKPNGARYLSGTEWEYEDAVNSPRKPPPQVLLFRRTEKPRVELDDPDFDEKRAQFRAVNDFFARFRNPDGSIKAGVNEYATPAEFKELLRQHLDEILHRLLPPAPRGGGDQPPPADFRKYLQDLWEETALIDIRGLFTGKPEAQRFPIEDLYIELSASGGATAEEPEPKSRPKRGDALLKAALQNQHLVIIGDPGCGKTTFLRWVAHCLAGDRTGRTPGAAGQHLGLDRARLPVLVPIADWLDFIARCKAQNKGPALDHGAEWLLAYLGERATDANQGLAKGDFRRAFQEGDCALLLDGLDEAPDDQQRQRARGLIETLARAYKDCPLVVTSRPAAYQDKAVLAGFTHTHIEALDAAAIDGFLARWSRALFPESENRAERHRKELAAALGERPEIRRMARNTVMLTALAVVHWNEKRLPEQRAELYESILNWLVKQREQRPGREKSQRCRQLLAELALAMQTDPGGRQVQVTRRWAAERLAPRFGSDAEATTRAEAFLAEEEIDSGIVVRRGHQLRFWHLTFQEYLSAQALAGWEDARRTDLLLDTSDKKTPALYRPEWRETVLLLAGVLCVQGQAKVDGLVAAVLDRLGANPSRAEAARAAGLLGAVVQDLSPFGYRLADPRYAALLAAAMAVFDAKQAAKIALQDRIAAARHPWSISRSKSLVGTMKSRHRLELNIIPSNVDRLRVRSTRTCHLRASTPEFSDSRAAAMRNIGRRAQFPRLG
ncbi:MAG TPA: NACHT domain-containing protein [Defluviicoccus sp.]|nr:NACHT domain-containing protein [Defluviicoccus sp.]